MQNVASPSLNRLLTLLAGVLVLKVNAVVVLGYRYYFPPNFMSDFLRGREDYFWDGYQWWFYIHIISGPIALALGLLLISEQFRRRWPRWHRTLGKVQVLNVLFLVVPSGLWMSFYAAAGPLAAISFAILSILTATSTILGWRSAVLRRFPVHRRWMWRSFLLLCSAVVLRLVCGLATLFVVDGNWFDPLASWGSWLIPVLIFEIWNRRKTAAMAGG